MLRLFFAPTSTGFVAFAEGGVFVVIEMLVALRALDGFGGAGVIEVGEVEGSVFCISPTRAWSVPTQLVNSVVPVR